MNVAKKYSIAYKGLKTGEHRFEFETGLDLFQRFENEEVKDVHCKAEAMLERSDRQMRIQVSITGNVVVECDRCLGDCEVEIDTAGELVVKFSNEPRAYDGDTMWLTPADDYVDLAQFIYESIVLALPFQRVHPDGACDPDMLKRFKTEEE